MLSTEEIADYVHGRDGSAEKQQFTFSEATKVGDALITHRHVLTDFPDGEPRLTSEHARATIANKAKQAFSWLQKGSLRKMSVTKRTILLILLFAVVFAASFALELQ